MRRSVFATLGIAALTVFVSITSAQGPGQMQGRGMQGREMQGRQGGRMGGSGGFQGRGPMGGGLPPLARMLDADGDGQISAEEISRSSDALAQLDRNGDGNVSQDEIFAAMRGLGRPNRPDPQRPGMNPPGGERPDRGRPGPGQPEMGPPNARMQPPGRNGGQAGEIAFTSLPLAKDDAERKILRVLAVMDKNERAGMMNVPLEDGRLLRVLTETIGAKHVVEIGTSNGFSGIWFCLAMRETGGRLTTFEIDGDRAALARKNFERAGVTSMVTLIEGDAHETIGDLSGPIDMVFLDADKEGYVAYLKKLLPLVRPGGLVVAHNMNQRQADARFVKAITSNAKLETLFLHMEGMGVAVALKKR